MREIRKIIVSKPVVEGAGVKLRRVFSHDETSIFDPFLLLDHFGSSSSADYTKGFPWHPHRGIETVTYMIHGEVDHEDSLGNKGSIKSGDIQWMRAGSGIIHEEMPQAFSGEMMGFQLWINLPRKHKMSAPQYLGMESEELVVFDTKDYHMKLIAGTIDGYKGPVKNVFVDVEYFDIHLHGKFDHTTAKRTVFIYVYEGSVTIGSRIIESGHCVLFEEKGEVVGEGNGKFIFIASDPLKEPIAWCGPIVMNTKKELALTFEELESGTFIK